MQLRVATYNIHKCIGGLDRRYRPERVVEVLADARADVLLLQEVDDMVPRSLWDRQVDLLGDALGMEHRAFFPNVPVRGGHYGNAILSRFPIRGARNVDLTMGRRKRRSALHATVEVVPGRSVEVFNLHLGLSERERKWQVRRLLEGPLSELRGPTLVGGDLNDVFGSVRRLLVERGGLSPLSHRPRTFPAFAPATPLDGIFVGGPARIAGGDAFRHPRSRTASDHLPLLATVRLDAEAVGTAVS